MERDNVEAPEAGTAGARELEAPRKASERPLPAKPHSCIWDVLPKYNCESPCLIFKRE